MEELELELDLFAFEFALEFALLRLDVSLEEENESDASLPRLDVISFAGEELEEDRRLRPPRLEDDDEEVDDFLVLPGGRPGPLRLRGGIVNGIFDRLFA